MSERRRKEENKVKDRKEEGDRERGQKGGREKKRS